MRITTETQRHREEEDQQKGRKGETQKRMENGVER